MESLAARLTTASRPNRKTVAVTHVDPRSAQCSGDCTVVFGWTERYCAVLCGTVWYFVVLCGTVWYCVVLCGTVRYCVVLCGTVRYCVVLCGTVRYLAGGTASGGPRTVGTFGVGRLYGVTSVCVLGDWCVCAG
jgi:hypothetical protein